MIDMDNGARPIQFVGTTDNGVVLCEWGGEYVVWRFWINHETSKAITEHGNYFKMDQYLEARHCFALRACRFFGWEAKYFSVQNAVAS